ncbi:LCP family protein [Lacticaseibacillus pantheris]|jgi:LCP family protein required for cell wall assembly|uniref:LCP family protein n=1 Tax=Lacticaseibacillus pantheris TaxID=171523 RepID=UPI0025936708|nr:LCP family protein [Lacticaseibacillus pantheris]WKF85525.1 LCP family protein [Lacticaseibacillus pantheris]
MDSRSNGTKKVRRAPHHPVWRFLGFAFIGILFLVGAYGFRVFSETKTAVNGTYANVTTASAEANSKLIKDEKPISILLLGTDTGALGRGASWGKGNSDSIEIVTINPQKHKTTITSIPRDTLAKISGTGEIAKINAAYASGGEETTLKTVQNLLNIKINYYITVNMNGLKKIVDAVGGVDVTVPFSWSDPDHDGGDFTKGKAHLNGTRALQFARMRYEDPKGDYGRQQRQQQVIKAIVKSLLSAKTLTSYESVLGSLKGSLKMNLTFDDLLSMAQNSDYRKAGNNIKKYTLQGNDAMIDGSAYQVASTSALQKASDRIHEQLGQSQETLSNFNTRLNATNSAFFDGTTTSYYTSSSSTYDTGTTSTYGTDSSTYGGTSSYGGGGY